MLDEHCQVKIVDFGLAKFRTAVGSVGASKSVIQASGYSPAYAAPELLLKNELSEWSDTYAFSITLWELLFRETPFFQEGVNAIALLFAIVGGKRPQIPTGHPYPKELIELVEKGWNQDARSRPKMFTILESLNSLYAAQ